MTLLETINKLQALRDEWTDDTEVFIDFDVPVCYGLDEITEDEEGDCILLHTHPFALDSSSEEPGVF